MLQTDAPAPGAITSWRSDLREGFHTLWRRTSRTHKRMVLVLIALGALLRIVLLKEAVIYEEAFTFTYYATRPVGVIVSDYSYPNNHIFHTLLVKLSTSLFGVGQVQLRLPALLAGVAALPLYYLFVRAMFNRYIAMMALALVASSGALIEYSALARGYSIAWLCMMISLLLGRHFAKRNSSVSAILLAVVNAVGLWSVPVMIYATVAVYIWLGFYLMTKYDSTLNKRVQRLLLSVVIFVVLALLLYAPVVMVHGIGQLFHHPSMGDNTWETFLATHQDRSFDLWAYFTETSSSWLALLGLVGVLAAIYITSKYRMLIFALVLGSVPIVLLQHIVGPPSAWTYSLFIFQLGPAIALFYLLKLVQDRLIAAFTKRMRTLLASAVIFVIFGTQALRVIPTGSNGSRMPGLPRPLRPRSPSRDRVIAEFPWEAPLEFYLMARHIDRGVMSRDLSPGGQLFIVVSPADGQTPGSVLLHNKQEGDHASQARKIQDWRRLEIYATHVLKMPDDAAGRAPTRFPDRRHCAGRPRLSSPVTCCPSPGQGLHRRQQRRWRCGELHGGFP